MKRSWGGWFAFAALALFVRSAAAQTIVVGGKAFTEQQIMTAMTAAILKAKGFTPERKAGMGMGPTTVLLHIELPNALFVILAGVRTAMAVNVGTAPIAFLIGGGGLGELIFTGIDLQQHGMMLAGAIPTALLAVAVDFLFGQAQYWLVPRGVNPLRTA